MLGRSIIERVQPLYSASFCRRRYDWPPFVSKTRFKHPVTFSGKIINEIIRNLIKFEGLLLSDDLSMNALSGSIDNRYIKALEAGCDIGLHCNGNITEMELIAKACPGIKDAAKSRIKVF